MRTLLLLCVLAGVAMAQYEAGFVKILQDKRYHSGNTFGNFRDQEDGTKYFEETDDTGLRRGYWEYIDENGQMIRNEFEAGPGIGFRITKSNQHAATAAAPRRSRPTYTPAPQPPPTAAPQYNPVPAHPQYHAAPVHVPAPAPAPVPHFASSLQPDPENLFDYPGNLEFSRSHLGHRFKFTAS
ncbi:uncharacterized protein LOC126998229 [Eriocheir sinensis]|uniref:uncharacterized protein LOC126998229 n=1 Tax=Eriocheir sinensis TaxID=95602 RepID=UPI0021C8DDFD|nr:uncharacterized protein LOC126998229 [Eriocheir sinensis]